MALSKSEDETVLYFDCHPRQSPRRRLRTSLA